jgi:hypothetical protein
MSGLIPTIKGAENAPLIDDEKVAENDNSNNNDPYNGQTTENALDDLRNPAYESIFDGNSDTYTVHKGNLSSIIQKSYELGPGRVPSNKPGTLYSL